MKNVYLKEVKEDGKWIIQVCKVKLHTVVEEIEIANQEELFQTFDKYGKTTAQHSMGLLLQMGYYKETVTVVGIGYTGVKSHIAVAVYREVEGKKMLADVYANCGSQKFGSGVRVGSELKAIVEPTINNITCKKCLKKLTK